MSNMEVKQFNRPDEMRELPKTRIEVVSMGDNTLMRAIFQPGWKWSECVKPSVGTDSCQSPHFGFVISGQMMVVMDDGVKKEIVPGDIVMISPGHDAWVTGNEPCVMLDFTAGEMYGKSVS